MKIRGFLIIKILIRKRIMKIDKKKKGKHSFHSIFIFACFIKVSTETLYRQLVQTLIFLIKLYQKYISPLKRSSCRFYPTCSEYAILALKKYGLFKGSFKIIWRLIRCNPFSKGGIDYP